MVGKEQRSNQHNCVKRNDFILLFNRNFLRSATLFAKSKNSLLTHLFADVVEEEAAGGKGAGGKKKGGGSMQTISATHRVKKKFVLNFGDLNNSEKNFLSNRTPII